MYVTFTISENCLDVQSCMHVSNSSPRYAEWVMMTTIVGLNDSDERSSETNEKLLIGPSVTWEKKHPCTLNCCLFDCRGKFNFSQMERTTIQSSLR